MEFNLADLFECVADAAPDRTAVVSGDTRLTFGQLDERSTRLANHLRSQGIEAGDHIGVYSYNRAEWLESMLAAFKMRAVPINVNFRYVEGELAYLLANADITALVYEAGFTPIVQAIRSELPTLRHAVAIDDGSDEAHDGIGAAAYEAALAGASAERTFGTRSPDDRYVLYTGGTTGMPKGTVWRQEDILFGALQDGRPMGEPLSRPEDITGNLVHEPGVFLVTAPLMHGGGQWASLIALFSGAAVVLAPGRRFDPVRVLELVAEEGVQVLNLIGDAMARPVVDALAAEPERYDTSSLFILSSGGAILSPSIKADLAGLLPDVIVVDGFGASETGDNGRAMASGPAGEARFETNPYTTVLDDDLRPLEPGSGEMGRLAKCGPIPLGYYNDPQKTAETFVEVDGRRWVIPGDFARIEADGSVVILGRGSVSINTGGEKVFPEEVESVLKAHPAVYDAIVVGVTSERWGQEVAALVQLRAGSTLTLDEAIDHCRGQLAPYKAPRRLVVLDELVRTPVGKPDYRWAAATATAARDAGASDGTRSTEPA